MIGTLDKHQIMDDYLTYMKLAKRSHNTIVTYTGILDRFLETVTVPINEITPEHVRDWIRVNGTDKKERTINTWLSVLSAFFTFCAEEGHIDFVPIKSRWRPRLPEPIPRYVDREEVAKLRLQADCEKLRNQTLFEFLISSGCRISEACNLDWEDIDLKKRTATVVGKGSKIRTVHLSHKAAILFEKLLGELKEDTSGVFQTENGQKIERIYAHRILSNMGVESGLKASFGPHRLRHTFATSLLSKGAELSFIADELGHSQVSTTRIYARIPKDDLITKYRKYMG